ncbi:hypothetical protein IEQ34_005081 [Dendrobium chrysotoxum]|uniref:Uncharacterized protein n=1 Tax=Dendrobium chrysotoxum TaxID=161865 RepID=A0AAV7HBN9_DENCH|nr:hypothetical protein IEQ34_005081 [Dendrobium chrysotoxum]
MDIVNASTNPSDKDAKKSFLLQPTQKDILCSSHSILRKIAVCLFCDPWLQGRSILDIYANDVNLSANMSKTTISSFVNNGNWCISNSWPMMLKEKITAVVI